MSVLIWGTLVARPPVFFRFAGEARWHEAASALPFFDGPLSVTRQKLASH
jgi:hypothetical protein